jgi:hypothetical protein
MKRLKILIASFFLLFFSGVTFANNWEKLLAPQDYAIYFDFKGQKVDGDVIKIWITIDYFRSPLFFGGKKLMSVKFLDQYDCEKFRVKRYFFIGFSDQMGRGDMLITNDSISKWMNVKNGTNLDGLLKSACKGEQ